MYFVCQLAPYCIPLSNQVRGLYYKLWTRFFPLIYGPSVKRAGHKSTGKTRIRIKSTYSMDQEKEVSKIFIISLRVIGAAGKETSWNLAGRTVTYGPQNWPITLHCYLHFQFFPLKILQQRDLTVGAITKDNLLNYRVYTFATCVPNDEDKKT